MTPYCVTMPWWVKTYFSKKPTLRQNQHSHFTLIHQNIFVLHACLFSSSNWAVLKVVWTPLKPNWPALRVPSVMWSSNSPASTPVCVAPLVTAKTCRARCHRCVHAHPAHAGAGLSHQPKVGPCDANCLIMCLSCFSFLYVVILWQ